MSTIDVQNAKQIRDPMEVHCGISARDTKVDLTFMVSGGVAAKDTNISESLDSEHWDMRKLTDLQGEGFPLDGTCELMDKSVEGSEDDGKIAVRSNIGGTVTITVKSDVTIIAVTIAVTGENESGVITANGIDYIAKRITVIPVNGKSITLTAKSTDNTKRIEIASVTPGITLELDQNNLISCVLGLRSDLSIINPTWKVSDIEIQAYWPDDISEAISNVGDDVPIWYYAGYPDDYSKIRQFYLSEAATMEENVITLKGEDASSKLEDKTNASKCITSTSNNGRNLFYNKFISLITDSGIKLMKKEAAPAKKTGGTSYTAIIKEHTSRELVADMMNLSHYGTFYPVFVDAGIPTVRWSKPTKKWDIYEEDCGSVKRDVERNIAKITTEDKNGVQSNVTKSKMLKVLETKNVEAGESYSYSSDAYYWQMSVSNAKSILITAEKAVWKAKKTTKKKKVKQKYKSNGKWRTKTVTKTFYQCIVKGKKANVARQKKSITDPGKRPGYTAQITPATYGKMYDGSTLLYPAYSNLFKRSNIAGSFTFKGDPRMQPRDVFSFHRLDGTTEDCTIESITLKHEGGGTSAELTYRKGIV